MVGELVLKAGGSAFGLFFVALGLYLVRGGRKLRRRGRRIAETETTPIRDLGPGAAEVKGTARPADGAGVPESPITRAESLATHVEVEKYRSSDNGSSWETIYEETDAVPFRVDDGTGEVRVEFSPEGQLDVELIRTEVGGGEEPPEPIRRFVEREADVDEATRHDLGLLSVGERRRYSEGVIEPGEAVYVLGTAREGAGWDGPEYVIDESTPAGDFIVSDKSEEDLIGESRVGGVLMYVFGGLAAGMGAMFTVILWLAV